MKKYVKPVVAANEGLAESIYMGSGNCYTFNARITQTPETGRDTFVVRWMVITVRHITVQLEM